MIIRFKKLCENAVVPAYKSEFSAGADLSACIDENITINSGETIVIPTGISVEIPENHFGMVCTRSGLAAKHQLVVLNSPGIIDADYRGEIKLIMMNHSNMPFLIEHGMRLAQLIIVPFCSAKWEETSDLSETQRGEGGLGSTGI